MKTLALTFERPFPILSVSGGVNFSGAQYQHSPVECPTAELEIAFLSVEGEPK